VYLEKMQRKKAGLPVKILVSLPGIFSGQDSQQKTPDLSKRGFNIVRGNTYASKGTIETYDLLSLFFWNCTTPSTLACSV
jgi:hypothetical protein